MGRISFRNSQNEIFDLNIMAFGKMDTLKKIFIIHSGKAIKLHGRNNNKKTREFFLEQ